MQLTIQVPDDSELAASVESWVDGSTYELKVKQTGVGSFELLEAGESEVEAEESPEMESEGMSDGKNPAMEVMIGKMRSGSKDK